MDIIQVSSATLKGLSGLSSVPKESLAKVCKYFLQVLIKGSSNVALDESLDEPLSSISTILLEAAKSDATTEQLSAILSEQSVHADVASVITGLYTEHNALLRQHIETTGISAPTVVGVDWRLDYAIRSKNSGRESAPVFYVCLKVKDRGLYRDIKMMASLEELQDMLSKLRDANKQVERVLNTAES